MTSILVAGETLVDFLPDDPGPLDDVETFHRRAGGAPANVSVGLARLDREPLFWTRVGDDPFGDYLLETLRDAGVPDDFLERDADAKTGLAFVSLDPDAERAFSFHRDGSADTRLQPGAVDDGTIDGLDWLHAGGVTLADEPARTATLDLMERAYDTDAVVSFDPNARPELWDEFDFASSCEQAFLIADVVKATPDDLRAAGFEGDPEDLAAAVCDAGAHTTLLTRGEAGALARAEPEAPWVDGDEPVVVEHSGFEVDPVDTTGAGDAFTAGAIASLADGESLADALAFANAVAARTTTARGAMTALPTREEVRDVRDH